MNLVEIKVNVDVDKPNQVAALNVFLLALASSALVPVGPEPVFSKADQTKAKKLPVKAAENVSEQVALKLKEAVEQPEETQETPAAEEKAENETTIKIEEVRKLVSDKVANNRDAIKAKLTELGANNVTSLDKKHFQVFADFLKELK